MTTPTRFRRALVFFLALLTAAALRAQLTEYPWAVEPGKMLLEVDGLRLSFDRADAAGNSYSAVAVASSILSVGLARNVDIQVGFDLFHRETFKFAGGRDSHSGIGDLSFRAKWTFWRNDSLGAAMAVIPYVKVPTTRDGIGNDSIEGGLIIPWAMTLGGFTAGAMFEWDYVRNDDDNGYDSLWTVTSFVERKLPLGLTAYAEAGLDVASTGLSNWTGVIGVGARWALNDDIWLDYEMLRGLNSRATTWTHVLRFGWGW